MGCCNVREFFESPREERKKLVARHGRDAWQVRLVAQLHSHNVQVALAMLLLVDVIALVVELVLDAFYPSCHVTLESCSAELAPPASGTGSQAALRLLQAVGDDACRAVCVEHPEWVEHLHEALFWISVVVLIIFEVELVLLLAATGSLFFRNLFYVFDFVVVTIAMALEFVFRSASAEEAAGLLVLLRVWRFVRLGHAITTDVHEFEHHKIAQLERRVRELEGDLAEMRGEPRPSSTFSAIPSTTDLNESNAGLRAGPADSSPDDPDDPLPSDSLSTHKDRAGSARDTGATGSPKSYGSCDDGQVKLE